MKIQVVESVLKAADAVGAANREQLNRHGILGVNLMSAPGSGKTTLLQKTIPALLPDYKCAVLVGDLQTTRDAERLSDLGAEVIQINTGRGCHLEPTQVTSGLNGLDLDGVDFLFIENVGNMVCPASFDLGEHLRVILLSVPEGDDKVAKYPTLFQGAHLVLLTKTDLLGVLDFRKELMQEDLARVNASVPVLELSTKSGAGFEAWIAWLKNQRSKRLVTN